MVVRERWLLRVIEQPIVASTCRQYVETQAEFSRLRIATLQQVCMTKGLGGISNI